MADALAAFDCRIVLYNGYGVYLTDELVTGEAVFTNRTDVTASIIGIEFSGSGKVSWDNRRFVDDIDIYDQNTDSEIYHFDSKIFQDTREVVTANVHRYKFKFPLTKYCVTSFEGIHGYIRYELTFFINREPLSELVYKRLLTVINPSDINTNPIYKVPQEVVRNATTCCWGSASRKIFLTLRTPFGAYAPGQNFEYSIQLNNRSIRSFVSYKIHFYRKVTYYARGPNPKERYTIKKLLSRSLMTGFVRNHTIRDNFMIPATPPTIKESAIISVKYILKLRARVLCAIFSNIKMEMDIVIGGVPLRETLPPTPPMNVIEQQEILPLSQETAAVNTNRYLPQNQVVRDIEQHQLPVYGDEKVLLPHTEEEECVPRRKDLPPNPLLEYIEKHQSLAQGAIPKSKELQLSPFAVDTKHDKVFPHMDEQVVVTKKKENLPHVEKHDVADVILEDIELQDVARAQKQGAIPKRKILPPQPVMEDIQCHQDFLRRKEQEQGAIPKRKNLAQNPYMVDTKQQPMLPHGEEQEILLQPEEQGAAAKLTSNDNKISPHTFQIAVKCDSPFLDADEEFIEHLYGFQPYYPVYKIKETNCT